MRQVEVNSDKYTAITVAMVLAFALLEVVACGRDLVFLRFHPLPRTWLNYLMCIFFVYVLTGSPRDRDRKLWRAYPFGAAGFGLFLVNLVLKMALPRRASGPVVMIPAFAGLAGSLLIILEIARWFRATVTLV
ncbi:MAG TPA: hypothetical protein VFP59_10870 [Candidatus Angelobacter sp.]|nr:hypothetical protein [Candidatus Angelobacter sp.]